MEVHRFLITVIEVRNMILSNLLKIHNLLSIYGNDIYVIKVEIDTEVIKCLDDVAGETKPELIWDKVLPVGVSKMEHYQGFSECVEVAKQLVYDATQRFVPNYMICASNIIPVLAFINGWKAASTSNINGPYMAG